MKRYDVLASGIVQEHPFGTYVEYEDVIKTPSLGVLAIARICHEVNRTYCQSLGDFSQPSWDDAPDWQKTSSLLGAMAHLHDPEMTPEQSHEHWLYHKKIEGWVYGKVKDAEKKTHPCCRPYSELPAEQRLKDAFFKTIVDAARRLV